MTPYREQPLSNPPKPRHIGWRMVCFVVCKVFGCTPGVFEFDPSSDESLIVTRCAWCKRPKWGGFRSAFPAGDHVLRIDAYGEPVLRSGGVS